MEDMKNMSSCEAMIMKIVWDSDHELSTAEVISAMKERYGKDYARTTVVTFIQRLIEKGYVITYRKDKQSYVRPIIKEQDYVQNLLRDICDFWFEDDWNKYINVLDSLKK